MENKQIEVMPKGQFELLGQGEQTRLMELWREQHTNKEIFEAMGYSSHQFYKLISKLGVKAKDNAPSVTKLSRAYESSTAPVEDAAIVSVTETTPVEESTQETGSVEEPQDMKTINISISDTVDKDKAAALFQSVLAFLSTGGEYNLSIVVSK